MADVAAKAISANGFNNGTVVVGVNGKTVQTYVPKVVDAPTDSELDSKYDNRLDEVRYYSGDTSA